MSAAEHQVAISSPDAAAGKDGAISTVEPKQAVESQAAFAPEVSTVQDDVPAEVADSLDYPAHPPEETVTNAELIDGPDLDSLPAAEMSVDAGTEAELPAAQVAAEIAMANDDRRLANLEECIAELRSEMQGQQRDMMALLHELENNLLSGVQGGVSMLAEAQQKTSADLTKVLQQAGSKESATHQVKTKNENSEFTEYVFYLLIAILAFTVLNTLIIAYLFRAVK